MPIQVTAEQEFFVGQPAVVEGAAPDGPFVAVFEDDESTGYSTHWIRRRKDNQFKMDYRFTT